MESYGYDLRLREQGLLPHIDIAGTDFTIDRRLKVLRETAAPWNRIELREAEMSPEGEEYYFLYDTHSHEEYVFEYDFTDVPDNVVFIKVPYEVRLDPYAVAIQYGIDPKPFVEQSPFEKGLKAGGSALISNQLRGPGRRQSKTYQREAAGRRR